MKRLPNLADEFVRLRDSHAAAMRLRVANSALGASVIRIFRPGTKPGLRRVLARLPVDDLRHIGTPADFDRWYRRQLARVAREINKLTPVQDRSVIA